MALRDGHTDVWFVKRFCLHMLIFSSSVILIRVERILEVKTFLPATNSILNEEANWTGKQVESKFGPRVVNCTRYRSFGEHATSSNVDHVDLLTCFDHDIDVPCRRSSCNRQYTSTHGQRRSQRLGTWVDCLYLPTTGTVSSWWFEI